MDISPATDDQLNEYDVIVTGIQSDLKLGERAANLNEICGGAIARLIELGEIDGKSCDPTVILAPADLAASHLIVVGMGDELSIQGVFRACAAALKAVTTRPRKRVLFCLDGVADPSLQESAVAGAVVGSVGQDLYREEKKRIPPEFVGWIGFEKSACDSGHELGNSINLTRRLVNMPAGHMYPETFAEEALKVSEECSLGVEVWDEMQLRQQRCEALLAVARGSARPPRMVIVRYRGGADESLPLTLVGKGVTFDSGGLSIKPSDGMKTMKCDMAGAATVLGTVRAVAKLKLPINVVGVMGLVENMIGPDSYKLGDVLTARNGRTIEVLNTDAEGRLVLADALDVAVNMKPERIIDLATLTGACVVALGLDVVGAMANNDQLCQQVLAAASKVGEDAWQLPMFSHFGQQIRSEIADIKNVGEGRWGGAITAAKFLEEFVGEVPWVHLDIAGPSFREKPKPWMDAGASGVMVQSLVELIRGMV